MKGTVGDCRPNGYGNNNRLYSQALLTMLVVPFIFAYAWVISKNILKYVIFDFRIEHLPAGFWSRLFDIAKEFGDDS